MNIPTTHRRTWQKREQTIAEMFGAKRNRSSGSSGRADLSSSDSTHGRLYLEAKLRAKHTAVSLWDDTKIKADREGKVPVVALVEKGRPGYWILVHIDHLQVVAGEVQEPIGKLCATVTNGN